MLFAFAIAACADKGDNVGSDSDTGGGGGGIGSLQLVAFSRDVGGRLDLFAIAEDGTGGLVTLASGEILVYGGSTAGGRIVYHRCDLVNECDVFSRNADGSGLEATLAADAASNEVFTAISSDGKIIIVRDDGVTTELISVNADGSGEITLAAAPTPAPPGEVFKGVTANGRVIFERQVGGVANLYSILADGSAAEVPLATTASDELFGGIF